MRQIGDHELLGELGRGGMGIVYKARHRKLNRLVALKMLPAGLQADRTTAAMFCKEAEAMASLDHPNIVKIFEIGEVEGDPFISMEYIGGGSLARELSGNPQPPDRSARMVLTLARAVQAAHEAGIVHRDLKPANVLLVDPDTPRITDFGLAKLTRDASRLSLSGEIKGTPCYMAPEQARGLSREIGPRADVYALGAILYEMLTGRPPFKGSTIGETLRQVIEQEPVPPARLRPRLPRDLETICLKCLSKDQNRRYSRAEDLAEDLRRFLDREPILARRVGPGVRALKWMRRRPAYAALAVASTVALFSLLMVYASHVRYQHQQLRRKAEIQEAVLKGEAAWSDRRWEEAKSWYSAALAMMGPSPESRPLGEEVTARLIRVERLLAEKAEQSEQDRRSREALRQLEEFSELHDEALYRTFAFTEGRDAPDGSLEELIARALGLYGLTVESGGLAASELDALGPEERGRVRTQCYELLLILADRRFRVGHPPRGGPPDSPQAEEALRTLDAAQSLGLSTRSFHRRRAEYLEAIGDLDEARDERSRAESLEPTAAIDYFLLGIEGEVWERDPEGAIALLGQAIRLDPEHFWAHYGLAASFIKLRRWDAAEAHLNFCLSQRPGFAWLYLLRSVSHYGRGDLPAAEADLGEAATLIADGPPQGGKPDELTRYNLLLTRGTLRIDQGRYEEAKSDLQEAIRLRPEGYPAFVNLCSLLEKLGDLDGALRQIDRAIALEPGQPILYRRRSHLRRSGGDLDGALADLERTLRLLPPDASSVEVADDWLTVGRIQQERGDLSAALEAIDRALSLAPDRAEAHRLRAVLLVKLVGSEAEDSSGRYREAIESLDEVVRGGAADAEIFKVRGLLRSKLGDAEGAIADYTIALEMAPDARTLVARGWLFVETKAVRLAVGDFDRAAGLDPDEPEALVGRGFATLLSALEATSPPDEEKVPDSRRLVELAVRDAVADAEKALALGPAGPRLDYNAVRILALAVQALGEQYRAEGNPSLARMRQFVAARDAYTKRAALYLDRAIRSMPSDRRASFREMIEADPLLEPILGLPGSIRRPPAPSNPPPAPPRT
ncbi:serine/threonine-protein kinase [Tautonia sociabilis]|uniref:Serine/threonine-protein kinase n=1 Tax=Tautonia sociabilis TaxID=2080755 RepID=A0A432MRZ0_9BACT|nr:serine/threonine-protein kinase [Tautonia sociabilis]RUL89726.1 serine/threonine-protein kinase [Tautonia sociabilis]